MSKPSVQPAEGDHDRPRFSIILNVYNGEKYLADTLRCVFSQSFSDWELIFWDDQSTDGSAALLEPYRDDPRLRYFYAPRFTPLGEARDLGIRKARGEWLAFIDHDDLWTVDKLEKQDRAISRHDADNPLGIVYSWTKTFYDDGRVGDFDRWNPRHAMPEGDIFEDLFRTGCFICQSSVSLKRSAVDEIGGIPLRYQCCPDYFLYTNLAKRYQAAAVQDVGCWYRLHPKNMSVTSYAQMQEEILHIVDSWQHAIDPAVYQRRRAIHETLLAVHEMRHASYRRRGFKRLLTRGSISYLSHRPFVMTARRIKKLFHPERLSPPQYPEHARADNSA